LNILLLFSGHRNFFYLQNRDKTIDAKSPLPKIIKMVQKLIKCMEESLVTVSILHAKNAFTVQLRE